MDQDLEPHDTGRSQPPVPLVPSPNSDPIRASGRRVGAVGPRRWHRCATRFRLRLENLGPGGSVRRLKVFPLPRGVLVDWDKALPANVSFDEDELTIAGGTARAILDALASLRLALHSGAAEHSELILEFELALAGRRTTAVTTFTLEPDRPAVA